MSAETLKWMLYYDRQEMLYMQADAHIERVMLGSNQTAVQAVTGIQRVRELLAKHAPRSA